MAFALQLVASCVTGCSSDQLTPEAHEAGVTREVEQGPVKLSLTASPSQVDFTQHAQVKLQIVADRDVTILESDYHQALSDGDRAFRFQVVKMEKRPVRPTEDGRLQWASRYELAFFLPGEYELPPAEVSFVGVEGSSVGEGDGGASAGPGEVQTLTTEPVTIVVRPPEGPPLTAEAMRQITTLDPIELPREWRVGWWIGPAAALLLLIGAVLLMRRRRRRRAEAAVVVPAHVWARQQFAALIADDLLAGARVQEFYYRVSAIVRGYIERRFRVSAPEMTTEEFLATAARDSRFGSTTTNELNRFLTACDLVKYARHVPGAGEPDAVFKAADEFVERTREREPSAEGVAVAAIEERAA